MRLFGCPGIILNSIDHLGSGLNWLFDIDALTKSINYKPVVAGNKSNGSTGTKAVCDNAGKARMKTILGKDYILLPLSIQDPPFSSSSKDSPDAGFKPSGEEEKKDAEDPGNKSRNPTEGKDNEVPSTVEPRINQEKDDNINSTNNINTASDGNSTNNVNVVSSIVNVAGSEVNVVDPKTSIKLPNDPNMLELKDIVYLDDDEDVGAEADINNLDTHIPPKKVIQALKDPSWIKAIQEELLQFKLQQVWTLVDLPNSKRAIDDIIFGSTKKLLCTEFEKMMHKKFQMSSIGELTFFLGLQVKQKEDGIFISHDKYVTQILKKFSFSDVKTASTPMETHKPLLKDADGEDVNEHLYRSMIGSLMYLSLLVSWMVTDLEDSKTHTVGEVWSREYMDHGFTKSMSELDRCYTMLQELRSMIVGGALIYKNREGSKHESRRIHLTIGDFGGNCASNQSLFNNGRIEEWEEEKKEDRVSTTKIFRSKILINNSVCSLIIDGCSINNLVSRKLVDFLKLPMEICQIEGYQVCRVPVTIEKSYKIEVLCIVDDIDECHILLGKPWRCEVNGKYDVKRNLYLFSWEGRRIAMVPPKVTPQLPKLEVKVEEKIVKAKVIDEHVEKIQKLI
ncbi:putative nucleotidyltransferase, ribonuclease H [Tanacetum coccineum]